MALSEVEMCNLSLGHIGSTTTIASLTEPTKEGKACNRLYAFSRDYVLGRWPWTFARARAVLALLDSDTYPTPEGWSFMYAYPNDAVRVRSVVDEEGERVQSLTRSMFYIEESIPRVVRHPYEVVNYGASGEKKGIATDLEEARVVYTKRVSNTAIMPDTFVDLFTLFMGSRLALALKANPRLSQELFRMMLVAASAAKSDDAEERGDDPSPDSPSISGR